MSTRGTVGTVVAISLLACAGCNRPSGKALESTAEFQQIKMSLDESQKANEQLKQDAKKLDISLKQAESKLAEETKAKSGLQAQVQDLTVSRTSLEAKVDELSKARVALDAKVNDLQKTIDSLTKARDAALEDAQRSGEGGGAERQSQSAGPANYGSARADQVDSFHAWAVAAEAAIGRRHANGVDSPRTVTSEDGMAPNDNAIRSRRRAGRGPPRSR